MNVCELVISLLPSLVGDFVAEIDNHANFYEFFIEMVKTRRRASYFRLLPWRQRTV